MATATARNAIESQLSSFELKPGFAITQDTDRLLDARQVAAKLGVSERFIRDHTTRRSPRIPGVRLGKLLRYRAADVANFVAELTSQFSSRRS